MCVGESESANAYSQASWENGGGLKRCQQMTRALHFCLWVNQPVLSMACLRKGQEGTWLLKSLAGDYRVTDTLLFLITILHP